LRPYLNKVIIPAAKGYATTELVPLRPDTTLLNMKFLSYILRSEQFVAFANGISTGTKMPRIPMTELRKFNCILPPLPLQQQFVEIATQAEATKESLRKSIENIDQVIKSLINQ
jgi:type I restriction enzyme S subunit